MWQCACCGKTLPASAYPWIVIDGETGDEVQVGSDCGRRVREAGEDGHTHDQTGNGPFFTMSVYADMA